MRLLKWLVFVGVMAGLVLVITPLVTRWYLTNWLVAWGYEVQLEGATLRFSRGDIELTGLNVHLPGGRGLRAGHVVLSLDWLAWAGGRLQVRSWSSQGVQFDLLETPAGLKISGLALQGLEEFVNSPVGLQVASLDATDTQICRDISAESRQCLLLGSLTLADAQLKREGQDWQLSSRSPASIENVYWRDFQKNLAMLFIQKAQFRDFVFTPTWTRVAQFQASGFHFVERSQDEQKALANPYQTQFATLLVTDVAFKTGEPAQLHMGLAEVTGWRQTLHTDRNAALLATAQLREFYPALGRLLSDPAQKLTLALGKTRVIDGAVAWRDESVVPVVGESLTGLNLELGAINTLKPDEAVPITLVTKLGAKGELQIRGSFRPFVDGMAFDLQGQVRGLDLTHYSAYIKTLLNEDVMSGEVDGTFLARASFKHVNVDSSLKLSQFYATGPGLVSRQAGDMTLARAFGLLRDRSQAVQMLWRQEFDLTNTQEPLKATLAKGFRRSLVTMAQNDYRSAGSVDVAVANGGLNQSRFEPFHFNPNDRQLSPDQTKQLNNLAAVLKSKPSARLRLCAVSTGMEWSALYNQGAPLPRKGALVAEDQTQYLFQLANLRARNIKAKLGELGVASARFDDCESEVQMAVITVSFMTIEVNK